MLTHEPMSMLDKGQEQSVDFENRTADTSGQVRIVLFRRVFMLLIACAAAVLAFFGILASPRLAFRSMASALHPSTTTWTLLSPTTWLTATDPITVMVQVTNDLGLLEGILFYEWQGVSAVPAYTVVSTQSFILAATGLSPAEGQNPITFTVFTSDTLDPAPSQMFLVAVDTVPPTATITMPDASAVWQAGGPAAIAWILTETTSGPAPVQVWFRPAPASDRLPVTTTTGSSVNWTVPVTVTATSSQAQIELELRDNAGNAGLARGPLFSLNSPVTHTIFLPFMRYTPCTFALPDCYEPNNGYTTAYGPLVFNKTYSATADYNLDQYDYYTTTLNAGARVTITLNYSQTKTDLDLYLYRNPLSASVAASDQSGFKQERIIYTPTIAGTYYLLEYVYSSTATIPTTYTLRINK